MTQREFLIGHATWYLACRWKAMGNQIVPDTCGGDLAFSLLGMIDYAAEMELAIKELRTTV